MNKTICIYHGNCTDGFSSAWVVWKIYGDSIQYYPAKYYGDPPPVKGDNVIMCDFSYPLPKMEQIIEDCNSLLFLDHHITAINNLKHLMDHPKVDGVLDDKRCGSMITWDWFFPENEPPHLLKIVQDRDLWKFEYPETKMVQSALFSYDYDMKLWDKLMLKTPVSELEKEGECIYRKHMKDIREFVTDDNIKTLKVLSYNEKNNSENVLEIPAVNMPYFYASECSYYILEKLDVDIACCFWLVNGEVNFSIRSRGDVDVAKIAQMYKGGGHKNAAGFKIPFICFEDRGNICYAVPSEMLDK